MSVLHRHLLSTLLIAWLAGCGGGGGDGGGGTGGGTPGTGGQQPPPGGTASTISCDGEAPYLCSGSSISRTDNSVAMTESGVQVYGRSTSDLRSPNPDSGNAYGLAPASGGSAEIRLAKTSSGNVTGVAILLRELGIRWDNATNRPPIIETFRTTQGRVVQNEDGSIGAVSLRDHSDTGFYDHVDKGADATQEHYANNVYFPRSGNPSRCDPGQSPCPTIETEGLKNQIGNWRSGGSTPDRSTAERLHSDGDLCAGDGPVLDGVQTYFAGCNNGPGSAYPGFKGYRAFENRGYQYSNLTFWVTQDTVNIVEFSGPGDEHNKNRRGVVAFGDLTPPTAVPDSGSATYTGAVYGWYANGAAATASNDVDSFVGSASITVNFATRSVTLRVTNTRTNDDAGTTVPVAFNVSTTASLDPANYFTSAAANASLAGGVSGRYFGPRVGSGASAGPAEIAGTFTLSGTAGQTAIGGFIVRKQ
jgi:hypothetical protein